jgi:saccharopine dehydrogenase-like NADP-dependent oxidoreductase
VRTVLVIGAGAQGGPCASILAGEEGVEKILLGDIDLALAEKVKDRIGSQKVAAFELDASQEDQVTAAAREVDVVINLTHLKFNDVIMSAVLAAETHYVDTASNTPFLEAWISEDEHELHREFKQVGKTALAGCGFAPGIANVLTRFACNQMERVESIIIRVGRKSPSAAEEVVSEWKPTWSPEILLEDYSEPPMLLINGEYTQVPIFSNPEAYKFPEPVGELLLSSHMHEEAYMIPKFYLDKGLQFFDFKYPVDRLAGAFIKMGFASHDPIEVKGARVAPVDVLMALVKRPANSFFEENLESILESDLTGIMDISVEGKKSGRKIDHKISYTFTDGLNHDRQRQLFDTFGTTMVYVALPAVVGAKMCVRGELESGVISPDSLDPEIFFAEMKERGVPFEFQEQVTWLGDAPD